MHLRQIFFVAQEKPTRAEIFDEKMFQCVKGGL